MTRNLMHAIRSESQRVGYLVPEAIWYLFGSVLDSSDCAADIDILILCPNASTVEVVRHELSALCDQFPIHLFLLMTEEEAELDFVAAQRCVQIFPITGRGSLCGDEASGLLA